MIVGHVLRDACPGCLASRSLSICPPTATSQARVELADSGSASAPAVLAFVEFWMLVSGHLSVGCVRVSLFTSVVSVMA